MKFKNYILGLIAFLAAFFMSPVMPGSPVGKPAYAVCDPLCSDLEHRALRQLMLKNNEVLKETISDLLREYQTWFMTSFFDNYVAPSLVLMAEQLTTVAYWQMFTLGSYFDAQQQIKTQQAFQELAARAHKEYRPSEGMCRMGTLSRGMAAAERKGQATALSLARLSRMRQLAYKDSSSAGGTQLDRHARLRSFLSLYCDPADNNGHFQAICGGGGPPDRINKDMNFTRTLGNPLTLDIDFTDAGTTGDEEDLLALNRNLFAHDLFVEVTKATLDAPQNQDDYLDARAIVAKRSVLENSFFALAGLKSAGSDTARQPPAGVSGGGSGWYVTNMLRQLGMSWLEAREMVGEKPSYFALLDIMSQKTYLNPRFFTELYDSPSNVERKMVAMQAVDLMVGREAFKSELRYESLLALWLELEMVDKQRAITARIGALEEVEN